MMYGDLGMPDGFDQQSNPYQRRGPRSYQQAPQQRALADALHGGAQSQPAAQPDADPSAFTGMPPAARPPATAQPRAVPPPQRSSAASRLGAAYQEHLGREASPHEIGLHTGFGRATAPQNISHALGNIVRSPEAEARRRALAQATGDIDPNAPPEPEPPPSGPPPAGPFDPEGDPTMPGQEPPPGEGTQDYQALFRTTMAQYGYGPDALVNAKAALEAQGIEVQIDSSGRGRGRIKLPNGHVVDVHSRAEGTGETGNWFDNPQGTDWAWVDHGVSPNPGGWDFGGGGGGHASSFYGGGGASNDWESRNTQPGGDALQAIYAILGPLMAEIFQKQGLSGALEGDR